MRFDLKFKNRSLKILNLKPKELMGLERCISRKKGQKVLNKDLQKNNTHENWVMDDIKTVASATVYNIDTKAFVSVPLKTGE